MERRTFLKSSLLGSAAFLPAAPLSDLLWSCKNADKTFKIGVCDWSIGKGSDIGAFRLAREIGADGVMVDVGGPENDLHLRKKETQAAYIKEAARTGMIISSLALGVFNRVPFHSDPRTEEWVSDAIDAAKNLKAKVLLLAFFNASDLRNDNNRKARAIEVMRKLAPKAAAKGVILGIESYLNADEHIAIMDAVGSDHVKAYIDFRNTADAGFNPVAEFKKLGKDRVCELHMKENNFLLGTGTIDWNSVANAIYETGYTGDRWMQIEGAIPEGGKILDSYRHNLGYLRKLFDK